MFDSAFFAAACLSLPLPSDALWLRIIQSSPVFVCVSHILILYWKYRSRNTKNKNLGWYWFLLKLGEILPNMKDSETRWNKGSTFCMEEW